MKRFGRLLGLPLLAAALTANADGLSGSVSTSDDQLYYEIGGGEPIFRSPNRGMSRTPLQAGISWNTDFSCNADFDPQLAVSNQLNGVTEGFKDMMGNIINNAKGAVASLPAMIIQRANPGLYDLLAKGVLQAKGDIDLSQTSCEGMQDMMAGENGLNFESWTQKSKASTLRQTTTEAKASGEDLDVVKTMRDVDAEAGNAGIEWLGGEKRGGQGQQPAEVIADTTIAGYNAILNRDVTNMTTAGAANGRPVVQYWSHPQEAANWATEVLGDVALRTCQDCVKTTGTPGSGLATQFDKSRLQIHEKLAELVSGGGTPSRRELDAISSNSIRITRSVVESLRDDPEKDVLLARLASEVAMARTSEQAMLMRRILQAGKREAHIANYAEAQTQTGEAIQTLNDDMQQLLFDLEFRERIASNTPSKVLERKAARKAARGEGRDVKPSRMTEDGALPKAEAH